ncbi:MAG: hypothetical protein V4689_14560 [Verrucomicrobiota bacterium]
MRRFTLPGIFLILLAALYFLWQYRFERTPVFPTWRLQELQQLAKPATGVAWLRAATGPELRLRVDQGSPGVVTRFDFPKIRAVGLLHLKFVASARKLRPGTQVWEDGRCIIEWHDPSGGSIWENDSFHTVRHDDLGSVLEMVAKPERPPAIPALRLENLGTSGDLELSLFEATVVRERLLWKIGRWVLMAAWLAWIFAWIRYKGPGCITRPLLAGAIWILMGIYFVVPGPWKSYRSFGSPFQIGEKIPQTRVVDEPASEPLATTSSPVTGQPAALQSVGRIPEKGDITIRIKHYVEKARPFLHIVLLFGPTFLIACLVGRRSACSLAIILALAIEAAQFAFGFGFDSTDIVDLVCDAAGIALALAVHHPVQRKWPRLIAC